jgi:hypothetical protein
MKSVLRCTFQMTVLIPMFTAAASPPVKSQESGRLEPAPVHVPAMWEYGSVLIAPELREHNPSRAQKDPTVVLFEGRWHVFSMTGPASR